MIFNSLSFAVFFTLFFIAYWFIFQKSLKYQNLLLLFGNYIFYAWADWRFLLFLIAISLFNFYLGIAIGKTENPRHKKFYLGLSILQGVGGLAFFKYFNFFIASVNDAGNAIGLGSSLHSLNIIVPLGISFFTFRTLSYAIDVEKGKIKPISDCVIFLSYVSFFPALLSGPIDKARTVVTQFETKRTFFYSDAVDGLRQILWGLFKKVVIADTCALYTSQIFDSSAGHSGSTLLLGAFLYSFQIYTDFSGYSDMAIGIAKLIGFNITRNFDFPFFSENIAEFWRKWHISLTSWLTEYVFTPLSVAFRDLGKWGLIFAIVINFTIIGIWHGANWTYILFGFLHGIYYIPLIITGKMNKKKKPRRSGNIPGIKELLNMIGVFILVSLTFIIFRSESIAGAFAFYKTIFSGSLLSMPQIRPSNLLFILFLFVIAEWLSRNKTHVLEFSSPAITRPVRIAIYLFIVYSILLNYQFHKTSDFIYFQF